MFWLIVAVCIAIDQGSKLLVARTMELGSGRTLIPGVLDLTYTHNTGAAFSILTGKQTFLIVVTASILIAMIVYVIRKRKSRSMNLLSAGISFPGPEIFFPGRSRSSISPIRKIRL